MKKRVSLRNGLLILMILCCVLSELLVIGISTRLVSVNMMRSAKSRFEAEAEGAMKQVELRLSTAIESSKAVSYNGVVKTAYRDYLTDGDSAALYKKTSEYLNQSFSRDERINAVYISFRDERITSCPYTVSNSSTGYLSLKEYLDTVQEDLFTFLGDTTTGIFFRVYNGRLYMVRNILDADFHSFAALAMELNTDVIFQALMNLSGDHEDTVSIDSTAFYLREDGKAEYLPVLPQSAGDELKISGNADGHTVECTTEFFVIYPGVANELGAALLASLILLFLLLILMVTMYRKYITLPVDTLLDAAYKVQSGEPGYQIEEEANSREFQDIYSHFNTMSTELKAQFERLYLEQQTQLKARIRALQSQINPHFLNNTLEVINWEARLAKNEKVSSMIEALSTLLDAALVRDGRESIPLSEELRYVDAYLYIIRERLGDSFETSKQIDEKLLTVLIPRLIVQPIVENAVEHDITPEGGGKLCIRVYENDSQIILEVEHDGKMTEEDLANIRDLSGGTGEVTSLAPVGVGQIGLRNVKERLTLLYGEKSRVEIFQHTEGTIIARILIPMDGKGVGLP